MERRQIVSADSNSPALPGVAHSTKLILDEFTHLEVSRQRKHMLRKEKLGLCRICTEKAVKGGMCSAHHLAGVVSNRERHRAIFGTIRRNKSKYQRVPE